MKGINQRHVQRRMRGVQTPDNKMVLLPPERERKPVPPCQEDDFFLLHMRQPFFLSGTSGGFCKFKFSFFLIQFKFYLFIYSFPTDFSSAVFVYFLKSTIPIVVK